MRVSVVINTLDRAESLERVLQSLRQLRYPAFEVIVVQGPCVDQTPSILQRHESEIRVGQCPQPNLAMSRNIGIAMAKGDVVAFLDDDAVPEPNWLTTLTMPFKDPLVAAVGGFIRDHTGVGFQHRVIVADRFGDARLVDCPDTLLGPGEYLSPTGTNIAIRRSVVLAVGGFDEEYAYFLDETDLNFRIVKSGGRIVINPEAEVHHQFASNGVRDKERVPRSLFLIARSKAYFCWRNAVSEYSPEMIRKRVQAFSHQHARWLARFSAAGKMDSATGARLTDELDLGLKTGEHDACSQPDRKLLPPALAAAHDDDTFKPYPLPRSAEDRLRVCLLSREFPPDGADETALWTHEVARDFAIRGHEVTVICHAHRTQATVEFGSGFWIHRVMDRYSGRYSNGERPRGIGHLMSFTKAAAMEILRIQSYREFHVVIGPVMSLDALEPIVQTRLPSVVRLESKPPTLHRGRIRHRRPEAALRRQQHNLLRSATLIFMNTAEHVGEARQVLGDDVLGNRVETLSRQGATNGTPPTKALDALEALLARLATNRRN